MNKTPRANAIGCLILLASSVLVFGRASLAQMPTCVESEKTRIWVSPSNPKADAPLGIMAVSTEGAVGELALIDAQGRRTSLETIARGGPPWSLSASLPGLDEGAYRIEAGRRGSPAACRLLEVTNPRASKKPSARQTSDWNLATEAFYSAWIEQLFDAPPEQDMSFPSLEPVLRDPSRNFLYNHFGLNEDKALSSAPDCADLPYVLRAYFAWKVGLPIAFRACSRGTARTTPRCGPAHVRTEFSRGLASLATFRNIERELVNVVHSGTARTALDDENSDLYPVAIARESLWPGTVYADPYGHVLVLTRWVAQTKDRPGMLLAVDAQPDNSVARKRFWEGTFLFARIASAGPGFKAFRPVTPTAMGGTHVLSNMELTDNPEFRSFSLEQETLSPDEFYARLDKLINPSGLDAQQAYETTLDALVEQLETRVTSVANAESYFRKNPMSVIPMPQGAAIFETIGPWEDFSTPSRDMRLIIAIHVLDGLPGKIVRHPELFNMNGASPQEARAGIERLHARRLEERTLRYLRSDGSAWELSLAQVLGRRHAFEMGYNPNDCAEIRWGATPGTAEYSTCRRHAPQAQRAKMEQYRAWFREARRPAR